MAKLPESPRFLALKGGSGGALAEIVNRISPEAGATPESRFETSVSEQGSIGIRALFSAGRTRITLLLWVVFFANLLTMFAIGGWMPTVLNEAGYPLDRAILVSAMSGVGGVIGGLLIAVLIDRAGATRTLAVGFLGAALAVAPDRTGDGLGDIATAHSLPGRPRRHGVPVRHQRTGEQQLRHRRPRHRIGMGIGGRPHRRDHWPHRGRHRDRDGPAGVATLPAQRHPHADRRWRGFPARTPEDLLTTECTLRLRDAAQVRDWLVRDVMRSRSPKPLAAMKLLMPEQGAQVFA